MPADQPGQLPAIHLEEATLEEVLPLRARILRAGHTVQGARARQDPLPGTRHIAAKTDDGAVVGTVTVFPDDSPLAPGQRALRFRGMAVDESLQGCGVGRLLMREVAGVARAAGATVLWANGRDTAQGFYEAIGFRAVGDGFVDNVMHLGHHVVIAQLDEIKL